MLARRLEPEVMDSAEEAREYDAMDHSTVNERFVNDFLAAVRRFGLEETCRNGGRPLMVLDCGTGTALIPILLGRSAVATKITAVDLSKEMLEIAKANVRDAGLQSVIDLRLADCKNLPFEDGAFDAVVSNSIIHHLAEPQLAFVEMTRVLRRGGVLFVRDLLRPESEGRIDELVETYAGRESERQKRLLHDSLHAALTLDEVRDGLGESSDLRKAVERTSDRHWTIAGVPHPV